MPEEFNLQELKKQYPEFFGNFPPKLLETALSEETQLKISQICLENGVADEEKIEDISYHVTSVLLGRLPQGILPKALQTNSKIDAKTAEKISLKVTSQIFAPVKDVLAETYKKEMASEQKESVSPEKEEMKRPAGKDTYREPII